MNHQQIREAREALEEAVNTLGDIPIVQLIVLLRIAEGELKEEDLDGNTLADMLHISQSAASRHVSALGEWSWRRKPGLQLVGATPDLNDRRRLKFKVTPKGNRFLKRFISLIRGK